VQSTCLLLQIGTRECSLVRRNRLHDLASTPRPKCALPLLLPCRPARSLTRLPRRRRTPTPLADTFVTNRRIRSAGEASTSIVDALGGQGCARGAGSRMPFRALRSSC